MGTFTKEAQEKGALANRNKALAAYYADPNYCLFCGEVIEVPAGVRPAIIRARRFCNQSHAARFNNLGVDRHGTKKTLCSCGAKKARDASQCKTCRVEEQKNGSGKRTLKDCYRKNAGWVEVRKNARVALKDSGREKICENCGWDVYVEVCHKKAITDFDRNTPLSTINSLDNLAYLCPNCHKMFDLGLLKI